MQDSKHCYSIQPLQAVNYNPTPVAPQPEQRLPRLSSIELKLPSGLAKQSLSDKTSKALRLLVIAKSKGHRVVIADLLKENNINLRTGQRLIACMVLLGWANTDGKHLFLRSWKRMGYKKRSGHYIEKEHIQSNKRFDGFLLALSLKRFYKHKAYIQRNGSATLEKGTELSQAFPSPYIANALGLKERRYKTLKSDARRFGYLIVKQTYTIAGKASHFKELAKHSAGELKLFIKGKNTVYSNLSQITVNLINKNVVAVNALLKSVKQERDISFFCQ